MPDFVQRCGYIIKTTEGTELIFTEYTEGWFLVRLGRIVNWLSPSILAVVERKELRETLCRTLCDAVVKLNDINHRGRRVYFTE